MDAHVFCLASSEAQAATIVRKLKSAGFSDHHISALIPDKAGTIEFAKEHQTEAAPRSAPSTGGIAGLLAGLSCMVIPGLGPFVAAGPIAVALGDAANNSDGLTHALLVMGIPDPDAWRFEGKVRDGNILISALAADIDHSKAAEDAFRNAGATDITICFRAGPPQDRLHLGAFEQAHAPTHSSVRRDPMD